MNPIFRFIPFLIVLGVMGGVLALPVGGQSLGNSRVHLPLVAHDRTYNRSFSIYGQVGNDPNVSQDGAILTLDFFDGGTTTAIMTTTVVEGRKYFFRNVPLPGVGEYYQVRYNNGWYDQPYDDSKITMVTSGYLASAVDGEDRNAGLLYLEPIRLLFPSDGRQYANFHSVEWYDNYGFMLVTIYDLEGNVLYETEPTRYITEYLFSPLPSELTFNTRYIWEVSIRSPNGYSGIDNQARREIIFVEEEPLSAPTGLWNHCEPFNNRVDDCDYFWDSLGEGTEYSLYGEYWIPNAYFKNSEYCQLPRRWHVRARNATAESTWSEWVTFTPPDCPY